MIWWAVVAGALCCYAFKLAGLSVPDRVLENRKIARIVTMLPVALLGALATLQTLTKGQDIVLDARVPAVLVAIVALFFRAPFIVVVALAAITAASIRAVT